MDRAVQTRILNGREDYQNRYAFAGPIDPRTGEPYSTYSSEYRQWAAEQTKPILSVEHANLIEHVAFGYRAHDVAPSLLSEGIAHGIVRSRYCGVPCQARFDWLNPTRGIVAVVVCDRFTCLDSHLRYSGPVDELAFHRALLAQHVGRHVPVHIIAVEKEIPHRCSVWAVSERLLRSARKNNEKALASLSQCRRFNRWPTGYNQYQGFPVVWHYVGTNAGAPARNACTR